MKKGLLKAGLVIVTFFLSLYIISGVMNQGNNNLTMEMAPATLPVITMLQEGNPYNALHGYLEEMDVALQRETITGLGENREFSFRIDTYGQEVTALSMEVRSCDGSRLIEETQITDLQQDGDTIQANAALKDLLDQDTEYALILHLTDGMDREIFYYTRVIWSSSMHVEEKVAYVRDFHEKTFDPEALQELKIYMESNSSGDNTTLHKVDIHSSLSQLGWGELDVTEETEPVIMLRDLASETASLTVSSMVSSGNGKQKIYYLAEESYRIRYTADRTYLLSFDRTMTQIPDVEEGICANDKIVLGIAGEDIPMAESEDGNIIVFESAGRLCSYNVTTNRLALLFSFYNEQNMDARTIYQEHEIKILDVDQEGNISFAVYGYMNRGRHEGSVGLQVNYYDSTLNTVEELVYVPYDKPAGVMISNLNQLLYMNSGGKLYLYLDHVIYELNVSDRGIVKLVEEVTDNSLEISGNQNILVWNQGSALQLMNLDTEKKVDIPAGEGESLYPLGFMGEDLIYGMANQTDIVTNASGTVLAPMYQVCIRNADGKLLKTYSEQDIYVTSCEIVDNQITLSRIKKLEDGSYTAAASEHILNNEEPAESRNKIVTVSVEKYEKIVQIQTSSEIDSKTLQLLTPKELEFEGERLAELSGIENLTEYYVYNTTGVAGIYCDPALAVSLAYDTGGTVIDSQGRTVWIKGNRSTRNQIMAIKGDSADEERSSLAVCLDTILEFEGVSRNSQLMLDRGYTVQEILQDNLADVQILNLSGCPLDAILYFTNRDIPVLCTLNNGEAVLIVGFNESNIVVMDPLSGTPLYKKGMNDSAEWLQENGNQFITYMR